MNTLYIVIGPFECKRAVLCNTTRRCANTFELVGFLEAIASLCFVDASANLHPNESRSLVLFPSYALLLSTSAYCTVHNLLYSLSWPFINYLPSFVLNACATCVTLFGACVKRALTPEAVQKFRKEYRQEGTICDSTFLNTRLWTLLVYFVVVCCSR